jgi:colicin import membrane protein
VAEPKTDALVKSLEVLVAEKMAVTAREKELVDGLNAVLSKMGYRVVAAAAVAKRRGRPRGSGARRPGRPKSSSNGRRRRRPGRPPKAKSAPKRRGRPPKAKTESS